MTTSKVTLLATLLGASLLGSGCSTVLKPTRPSEPVTSLGGTTSFRFEGEQVVLREPGMPLANSRAWQREVQNYTATSLNTLLSAAELGPAARTVVVFDLASPGTLQVGIWKEMTIELFTTLPDGRVVRSKAMTEHIDAPLEHFLVQGMRLGGSALDVGAAIASIVYIITQNPVACGCFVGSLVGGLTLNIGQSASGYFVAAAEERRWSDLFQRALQTHAKDIQRTLQARITVPASGTTTEALVPTAPGTSASEPLPPPPPLVDPADRAPALAAPF
ncbi:MAG: hypothetical protein ACO3JL_20230 [Myxococcota bacterium]